jgi:hypothetical protein
MLYILDTDHVSLLQRGNTPVRAHLEQISIEQRAVTIITVIEQLSLTPDFHFQFFLLVMARFASS